MICSQGCPEAKQGTQLPLTNRQSGPSLKKMYALELQGSACKGNGDTSMIEKKEQPSVGHKIGTVSGTILCILLVPVLIINITLIIRSFVNPDKVPSVGRFFPLIVLTDSMFPEIESGDLIICRTSEPEDIAVGDVISFFDPAGNGTSIVTHRVVEVMQENGSLAWKTKGDANNVEDSALVPAQKLVGVYRSRIAGAGNIAMFMQTTQGLILCVVCPILLLVGYDIIRRRMYEKAHKQDTEALLRELEELRSKTTAAEEE